MPILSPGEWITLLGMAVTVVSGYAVLRAKVVAQDRRLDQLEARMEASNVDQGRRLGALEGWRTACEAVERDRRRARTGAIPAAQHDELND